MLALVTGPLLQASGAPGNLRSHRGAAPRSFMGYDDGHASSFCSHRIACSSPTPRTMFYIVLVSDSKM